MCMGYFPRWYFDSKLNKCKTFIFGGCQGNGNNFESIEECERTCLHASKSLSNQVEGTLLMIVLVCCLRQVPYFDVFLFLPCLLYISSSPHPHPCSLSLFCGQGFFTNICFHVHDFFQMTKDYSLPMTTEKRQKDHQPCIQVTLNLMVLIL